MTRKLKMFSSAAAVALMALALPAQTELSAVAAEAQSKLDDALARLAAVRTRISAEKVPLATERDRLFAELRDLRREADRAQRLSDNQSADLGAFEAELKAQAEVVDYLINLSTESGRTMGSQLDPSEMPRYREMLASAEAVAEDPYLSPLEKLEAQNGVMKASLARMRELSGGAVYEGKAILPSGVLESGSFVRFGPVTLFASASGAGGLVEQG